eukprot:767764-Hanusia_phi.AAC.2
MEDTTTVPMKSYAGDFVSTAIAVVIVGQEFMIAPLAAESFHEAIRSTRASPLSSPCFWLKALARCRMGAEVYHVLRTIIVDRHGPAAASIGEAGERRLLETAESAR